MEPEHDHPWDHPHPWGAGHEHVWGQVQNHDLWSGWSGPLLSMLTTLFGIALLMLLVWAVLRWIVPYIMPVISEIVDPPSEYPPALEILRQRYAAGDIDAITFEQMRERLEASYHQESFHRESYQQQEEWHPS